LLPANAWGCLPSAKRLPANAAANAASQCLFAADCWPMAKRRQSGWPIALPSWATRRRHPAHSPAGELLGGGAVAVPSALEYGLTRSGRCRCRARDGGAGEFPSFPPLFQQPFNSSSLSAAAAAFQQQQQQPFQPFCLPACLVSCTRASLVAVVAATATATAAEGAIAVTWPCGQ
jgi:hypothetical protein